MRGNKTLSETHGSFLVACPSCAGQVLCLAEQIKFCDHVEIAVSQVRAVVRDVIVGSLRSTASRASSREEGRSAARPHVPCTRIRRIIQNQSD